MEKKLSYAEKPLTAFLEAKTGMLFFNGMDEVKPENRHLAMIGLIQQAFMLANRPREIQGDLFEIASVQGADAHLAECLGCIKELNKKNPVHLNARVSYKTLHAHFKDAADLPVNGLTVIEALSSFNTNNNTVLANQMFGLLSSEKARKMAYGAGNYKGKGMTSLNH